MLRYVLAPVNAAAARALGIPRTIPSAGKAVAITFDDGPHPEGTPRILEILAEHNAKATFFVIGEQVAKRPQLARRVLDEGHAIALHGHRHRLQTRLTARQLEDGYERGRAAIEDATATRPTRHRPPYGIYSPAGLRLARENGLEPLLWSAWGKDWRKFTTPQRIAAGATRTIAPGAVILLHDADFYSAKRSHERTVQALPMILSRLESRGIGTVLAV